MYKLKFGFQGRPAGALVYDRNSWDYGLASDDSRLTGILHVTVTDNENGDPPGFTIPKGYLEEVST